MAAPTLTLGVVLELAVLLALNDCRTRLIGPLDEVIAAEVMMTPAA